MRKITPLKGIELRGQRIFVPGAEFGPAEPNVRGVQKGEIYAPGTPYGPVPPGDQDFGSIWITAGPASFYTNNAGTSLSFYDLGNVNPTFQNVVAAFYPGGASDDNWIQWEVPVPVDMDPVSPQLTAICHFIIPT